VMCGSSIGDLWAGAVHSLVDGPVESLSGVAVERVVVIMAVRGRVSGTGSPQPHVSARRMRCAQMCASMRVAP
jgi:hypothetical protein